MEKDILENNFETIYKDYKAYESYLETTKKHVEEQRNSFKDRATKGVTSDDDLVSELFDLSIKPIQSEEDLRILRDRLLNTFDAYKIVLDFPDKVKEEVKNLRRPLQAYRIDNGEQVEIDKEKNDKFKEEAKKTHLEIVKSLQDK